MVTKDVALILMILRQEP